MSEVINPIIEANIKITFDINVEEEIFIGDLYKKLKSNEYKIEKLPILNISKEKREKNEKLKYQPHYRFESKNHIVLFGSNVFIISIREDYKEWELFYPCVAEEINKLASTKTYIKSINSLSLKYLNFTKDNIFNISNLNITLQKEEMKNNRINLAINFKNNSINTKINLSNTIVIVASSDEKEKNICEGSLIDIESSINDFSGNFFENYKSQIEKLHRELEDNFLKFIPQEYLDSFTKEKKCMEM